LEIIIGAAPLVGLLGTVVGLVQVFDKISIETGAANQAAFSQGIALALSTTVIGLIIAIPCLVGNGYLQRTVETYAVQIESLLERINAGSKLRKSSEAAAAELAK
jgi:biopolymer transport protein ExbB